MCNLRIASAIVILLSASSVYAQELGFSRRLLNVTTYLNSIENEVLPRPLGDRKGSILVIFRTSEQGAVIDARVSSGPKDLGDVALEAVNRWRFQPVLVAGQPIQMNSAAIVEFARDIPDIQIAKAMTADQLSPNLGFKCLNELLRQDPHSLESCRQQLKIVSQKSTSSSMDRFTANDEFGLALLKYSQHPKPAIEYFSKAIELAPDKLTASDAEWAYVYWHRAAAEQRINDYAGADRDFKVAEGSLRAAEKKIGAEKPAAYYHHLLVVMVEQHAALLESENKGSEAERVRAILRQEE